MTSAEVCGTEPSLADLVRLEDPEFYLDAHPVYDRMRREQPVYYYAPLDLFVLTRFADMREAARRPDLFSSAHGVVLSQLRYQREGAAEIMDQFIDPEGEIFAFTDPPRHRELRKVLMPAFSPRAVTAMSAQIAEACRLLVESISPGAVTDVVEQIAAPLPILVATRLIGVPRERAVDIKRWSDARELLTSGVGSQAQLRHAASVFSEMNGFLREQFAAKRARPGDDLMSVLLGEELDGVPLSEPRLLTYCHQVLSVGNDTTRSLLASFAIALAQHPDQLDLLAADRALMPAAIEEALRWSTPGRGFVRTATRDTEIAGQPIRAGQRVYLLYAAGNFDPAVFARPRRFDILRAQDQQHLAFGFGPHVCIAGQLVRLVTALLFGELLDHYPRFELAGPPEPIRHVLRNGWRSAPMVFRTSSTGIPHLLQPGARQSRQDV
jgi:cytochrome P450